MSEKSQPIADEQKKQEQRKSSLRYKKLERAKTIIVDKYSVLEKEMTIIKAKLEIIELAQRVVIAKPRLNSCPNMVDLLRERQQVEEDIARIEAYLSTSWGAECSRNHQRKAEFEADLEKLDATFEDILSNLDKKLPTTNPRHRAVIKAIFSHTRSDEPLLAKRADVADMDIEDLIEELGGDLEEPRRDLEEESE